MQDPEDKHTIPLKLPKATGARQATYVAKQRAAGLVQVNLWLTPAEKAAVLAMLDISRGDAAAKAVNEG
jgi:PhoPQ-activated pathogenicity-related protein